MTKSLSFPLAVIYSAASLFTATSASADPVQSEDQGSYHISALRGEIRPRAMAVDPITQTVYFSDPDNRAVWSIDAQSHRSAGFVQLDQRTGDLAVDSSNGTVYVAIRDGVAVIEAATGSVVATVPVPRGIGPLDIAVDPGTHAVYLTSVEMCGNVCFGDGTVSVIDGTTRTLAGTMSAAPGGGQIAVDPVSHAVYVSGGSGISVFDGPTRTLVATIPAVARDLAVDPGTRTVYASSDRVVTLIDSSTNAVTATVPVDIGHYSWPALAVDPGDHTVYMATGTGVSVIDPLTRTVTGAISLPGTSRRFLAVGPGTHTLFVTEAVDNALYLIDRRA